MALGNARITILNNAPRGRLPRDEDATFELDPRPPCSRETRGVAPTPATLGGALEDDKQHRLVGFHLLTPACLEQLPAGTLRSE